MLVSLMVLAMACVLLAGFRVYCLNQSVVTERVRND
jgi:hypothetical protein